SPRGPKSTTAAPTRAPRATTCSDRSTLDHPWDIGDTSSIPTATTSRSHLGRRSGSPWIKQADRCPRARRRAPRDAAPCPPLLGLVGLRLLGRLIVALVETLLELALCRAQAARQLRQLRATEDDQHHEEHDEELRYTNIHEA